MQSVTQERALDEFLSTAKLADTNFAAERLNVKIIANDQQNPYLLKPDKEASVLGKHREKQDQLRVPRRPHWDASTTPAELEKMEKEAFLEWRRGLATLQESDDDILMTPFERNLEVWRQLWRVIERSDLVVQIVDARNPLYFRCEDLERYVLELDVGKENFLLVNKADLMTLEQRRVWAEYFSSNNIQFAFFSATALEEEDHDSEESDASETSDVADGVDDLSVNNGSVSDIADGVDDLSVKNGSAEDSRKVDSANDELEQLTQVIRVEQLEDILVHQVLGSSHLAEDKKVQIGLVGYPNVGKSSTINALIGAKKVSVSATPGKTKHFQTILLSPSVILCDCPGLVFPNFATTKADLVCNGALPIDQLREHTGPVALVSQRIPQNVLEEVYGISIHTRPLEDGGTGVPTADEVLSSYAKARGFATQGQGNPDMARASRYILKDYVRGKLLFIYPPPDSGIDAEDFNREVHTSLRTKRPKHTNDRTNFLPEGETLSGQVNREYFGTNGSQSSMKLPFQHRIEENGRILTGRKARLMAALSNGMDPKELAGVGGGKKHFKHNKRVK